MLGKENNVGLPSSIGTIFVVGAIEADEAELLPHWLAHYTRLGAGRILLAVPAAPGADVQSALQECARRWSFETFAALVDQTDILQQTILRKAGAIRGDWMICADLTELHEFPAPLGKILARAHANGVTAIYGKLLDRVAADGSLPHVRPTPSIWDQFPIGCRLIESIARGDSRRLMLSRFDMQAERKGRPGPPPIGRANQYVVHHFKWFGEVRSKLQRAIEQPSLNEDRRKEIERLLEWFEGCDGRVNLFDPAAKACEQWHPFERAASIEVQDSTPKKLSYIGDKVVLLHCDRPLREELRLSGLKGDFSISANGVDSFLNHLVRSPEKSRDELATTLRPWLDRLRNEAAMSGTICTLWMPNMPASLVAAITEIAGENLIEITADTVADAVRQIEAHAQPLPDTAGKVFAVCAIRNGGTELLPHWLEHYSTLGVDKMFVGVFDDVSPAALDEIEAYKKRWGFTCFAQTWQNTNKHEHEEQRRTGLRLAGAIPETWVMHTDLDELHEFPAPLSEIVAAAKGKRIKAVFSQFLDRVAADGSLPPVRPSPSLWVQFPIGCLITAKIARSATRKIMLATFDVRTISGHHFATNVKPGLPPIGQAEQYVVHHFKWHDDVVPRLKYALEKPKVSPYWQSETKRLIAWIDSNGGKINVSDPLVEAKTLPPPRFDAAHRPPSTSGKIFAVCTICNGRADLLPHWLEHYTALGVDRIVLVVAEPTDEAIEQTLQECAQRWSFERYPTTLVLASGEEQDKSRHQILRQAGAVDDSWIVHTDLDEFHEFPAPLSQIVAAAQAKEVRAVYSHFVDRVAADGSMPQVQPTPSIWEQFPFAARLTERILHGWTQKIMLARFDVLTTSGHHHATNARPGPVPIGRQDQYVVHHFKWHGEVLPRLHWGLAQPQITKGWKDDATRFLTWLQSNGGKINLNDPLVEARIRPRPLCGDLTERPAKSFALFTLSRDQSDFLAHWLDHYATMGVNQLLVAVADPGDAEIERTIEQCAKRWSFQTVSIDAQDKRTILRQAGALHGDWIIHADGNELHEFPAPLSKTIVAAEAKGIIAIVGHLVDHVTADGSVPLVLPLDLSDGRTSAPPLWEQFPYACLLRAKLAGGVSKQLMLARFEATTAAEAHAASDTAPMPIGQSDQYVIHRFNWHSDQVDALRRAINQPSVDAVWKAQTTSILTWLAANSGRLNLHEPLLELHEVWHPSRLQWLDASQTRLPYVGDKVVLLHCDQHVYQSLRTLGMNSGLTAGGAPTPADAMRISSWLDRRRNEAAMTGTTAVVWMPALTESLANAIRRAAEEDLLEITAASVADAVRQIETYVNPESDTAGQIFAIGTICPGTAGLLPHWLEHHTAQGVDRILLAVPEPAAPEVAHAIEECAKRWSFETFPFAPEMFAGQDFEDVRRTILRQSSALPGTWVFHTDLDDLPEFPAPARQIIAAAEAEGLTAVFGQVLDRAAPDGTLRPILPAPSIWEQFPIGCRLTDMVTRTQTQKLMIAQFGVRAELARHVTTHAGIGTAPIGRPNEYQVHHFWHAGLPAKLQWEIAQPTSSVKTKDQAKSFLVWLKLNNGRINLNQPILKAKPQSLPLRLAS